MIQNFQRKSAFSEFRIPIARMWISYFDIGLAYVTANKDNGHFHKKSIHNIFLSRRILPISFEVLEKFSHSYLNLSSRGLILTALPLRILSWSVFKSSRIKRFANGNVFKLASEFLPLLHRGLIREFSNADIYSV